VLLNSPIGPPNAALSTLCAACTMIALRRRADATMDIGGWLRDLGLEQCEAAFRENGPHVLPGQVFSSQIDAVIKPQNATHAATGNINIAATRSTSHIASIVAMRRSHCGTMLSRANAKL
jgi:hypothetical protein